MDFLKKWFNRVIGWIAYPVAKAVDIAIEYIAPLAAMFRGIDISWTWRMAGRVLLGGLLLIGAMVYMAASIILTIAGLTLLLGLLFNPLVANIMALVLSIFVVHEVVQSVEDQRADEISVELA